MYSLKCSGTSVIFSLISRCSCQLNMVENIQMSKTGSPVSLHWWHILRLYAETQAFNQTGLNSPLTCDNVLPGGLFVHALKWKNVNFTKQYYQSKAQENGKFFIKPRSLKESFCLSKSFTNEAFSEQIRHEMAVLRSVGHFCFVPTQMSAVCSRKKPL